jgi:fatty-acyl-CoA synthase
MNATAWTRVSGEETVYALFSAQAKRRPDALALECAAQRWSYAEVLGMVERVAAGLRVLAVAPGDRVAVLSENRVEYTVLQLACARIGAIVACLNWRLALEELTHCVVLAGPKVLFCSASHWQAGAALASHADAVLPIEECFSTLANSDADAGPPNEDPERGLLLLNTSGTTGLPKAALISHRAEIARMLVLRADLELDSGDAYIAWSPMFHMGGTEHTLASLMFGAPVLIIDGFDVDAIVAAIAGRRIGWLLLVPATIEPVLERLQHEHTRPVGVKVVGCMADLVPPHLIEGITRQLGARFLNSFGSTETGLPPASGHLIGIGEVPLDLAKRASSMTEFRLVDNAGCDVADGEIGEGVMRGPTLFSGYWSAEEANREAFQDGWFRMGDLFRRTHAGGYEFVGRSKYLIKSGGENIYPAEIERVLLSDPRIADAAVVRKPDRKWGEIPVAFVARHSSDLTETDVRLLCRRHLAGYKQPREIYFVAAQDLPRSATGKIVREALETRLQGFGPH